MGSLLGQFEKWEYVTVKFWPVIKTMVSNKLTPILMELGSALGSWKTIHALDSCGGLSAIYLEAV
jgi:hypothetical protein